MSEELDMEEALHVGDFCEDCGTHVASDGECECNQEEPKMTEVDARTSIPAYRRVSAIPFDPAKESWYPFGTLAVLGQDDMVIKTMDNHWLVLDGGNSYITNDFSAVGPIIGRVPMREELTIHYDNPV